MPGMRFGKVGREREDKVRGAGPGGGEGVGGGLAPAWVMNALWIILKSLEKINQRGFHVEIEAQYSNFHYKWHIFSLIFGVPTPAP